MNGEPEDHDYRGRARRQRWPPTWQATRSGCNRTYENIQMIAARRHRAGLETGSQELGPIHTVIDDMARALDGAHLIMVVVRPGHRYCRVRPSICRRPDRAQSGPHGRRAGVPSRAAEAGCTARSSPKRRRSCSPAAATARPAQIFRRKNTVPLAALPSTHTQTVLDVLQEVYPQFIAAERPAQQPEQHGRRLPSRAAR